MFLRESFCVFCLNPRTARLGLDKKGRPYLHCAGCGARSFLPLYDCLMGLAIIPPLVNAWMQEIPEESRRAQFALLLAELKEKAQFATARPAPVAGSPEAGQAAVDGLDGALHRVTG